MTDVEITALKAFLTSCVYLSLIPETHENTEPWIDILSDVAVKLPEYPTELKGIYDAASQVIITSGRTRTNHLTRLRYEVQRYYQATSADVFGKFMESLDSEAAA